MAAIVPLKKLKMDAIKNAISVCGGDKIEAANRLGISKTSIYRLTQKKRRNHR